MATHVSIAEDLHTPTLLLFLLVVGAWSALLTWEIVRQKSPRGQLLLSGVLAAATLLLALLRPVRVQARTGTLGPRVAVLVDRSRRLLLPADRETEMRTARAEAALIRVNKAFQGARISLYGFGDGELSPLAPSEVGAPRALDSDLSGALRALARAPGEHPQAVVVLSDGRFSRPSADVGDAELRRTLAELGVPVHTVSLATRALPDAALRNVQNAGVAVAHQPLALRLEVSCTGGLSCSDVPVSVRELRQGEPKALLAEGVAKFDGQELTTLELSVTLERAGTRLVEIEIRAPEGDRIPDNDRRILTFNVTRDRVRLLHVAGRPTYDVRSLRMWLKSNEAVDLVAFFILRTRQSDPNTSDTSEELSLIPFPVHDLFTEHLPSFDAIVLQDIDAVDYDLAQYLPALERYVRSGGGLIMVGGPSAFAGGGYAHSALERVLPTSIGDPSHPFDLGEFLPKYTDAGRVAPVLGPLRDLVGSDLPKMVGSNTLGAAKDGAIVLWERPARRAGEPAMPVLSLSDAGDGRSIALAVDGTHQLAFSEFAERTAGRAYGALWDGLLGWLMRDPRYEAARIELIGSCIAGSPSELRVTRLPGTTGNVELEVEPLAQDFSDKIARKAPLASSGFVDFAIPALKVGGYTARARVGQAPATRFDFACERGGSAFSDSRPDAERLERIAKQSQGRSVDADHAGELPLPPPTEVAVERQVSAILPAWLWALFAAAALGWHWIVRRRAGLP